MGLFYFLRIQYKLLKRRFSTSVASFCKRCGRDVHDFTVDDEIWNKVEKHIKYGYTLCYDCFCELCLKENLPSVWKLERLNEVVAGDKGKGPCEKCREMVDVEYRVGPYYLKKHEINVPDILQGFCIKCGDSVCIPHQEVGKIKDYLNYYYYE